MPRTSLYVILLTTLLFGLPSAVGQAQERNRAPVESKYSQVVKRAFQFSRGLPVEFKDFQSRIVLRFLPSFGSPESQIVILKKYGGEIQVSRYGLAKGARPISEVCDTILEENPEASVDDILERISVEKAAQQAEGATARLVDRFSRLSIPTNLSTDITLDGTIYELWVQTPSNQIHARFSDGAYGDATDATPIVQWMKAVRTEVEAQQ